MKYHLLTGTLLIINLHVTQAQTSYPLPQKTEEMLFYLQRSFNYYRAYSEINNQLTELESIFIKATNNPLGIPISFEYIEVSGISTENGKKNTERIIL